METFWIPPKNKKSTDSDTSTNLVNNIQAFTLKIVQGMASAWQGGGMTHFSSLSSRTASFFCFLVSSRFLRASARSLTALSLSRLRLSHSVLTDDTFSQGITQHVNKSISIHENQVYISALKKCRMLTVCSPSLLLSCPSPERPSLVDTWLPRPLAVPPSAPERWPRTAFSVYRSPCWLAPCPEWQSLVSDGSLRK